jgi:hypothetical protein
LCEAQKEPPNIAAIAILVEENDPEYDVHTTVFGTKNQLTAAVAHIIEEYPDIVARATFFLKLQKQIKG